MRGRRRREKVREGRGRERESKRNYVGVARPVCMLVM